MSAHTPGPWQQRGRYVATPLGPVDALSNDYAALIAAATETAAELARVRASNAELVEALNEAAEVMRYSFDGSDNMRNGYKAARAALAKAGALP